MCRTSLSVSPSYDGNSLTVTMFDPTAAWDWDDGAGDGLWTTALNWSSNILPGTSDDVTIGADFSVTLNSVASVNSLTLDGSLTLAAGGSLTLGSSSTFSNTSVFTMSAGALVANGGFTSNGAYTQNGGTIDVQRCQRVQHRVAGRGQRDDDEPECRDDNSQPGHGYRLEHAGRYWGLATST